VRFLLYLLFAVGGGLILLALAIVFTGEQEPSPVAPQSPQIDLSVAKPANENAPPTAVVTPAVPPTASNGTVLTETSHNLNIDIARVKADGAAVIAGTAAPDKRVKVMQGDVQLGQTVANAAGEWVIVLEKPLAPGQHLITVISEGADGSGKAPEVNLAIEIFADMNTQPLVALLPGNSSDAPVLIQSPDDAVTAAAPDTKTPAGDNTERVVTRADAQPPDRTARTKSVPMPQGHQVKSVIQQSIAPTAIVWRDEGAVLISGVSTGGMRVEATVNGAMFGEALVLASGEWRIGGTLDAKKSVNQMRFSLVNADGKTVARYDLPLKSRDLAKSMDGSTLVIVNKGDALWRIAYRRLGEGTRYVDIVRRNSRDIANPDLIYPKQIFAIPK